MTPSVSSKPGGTAGADLSSSQGTRGFVIPREDLMAEDEEPIEDEEALPDAPERRDADELMDHGAAGELGPMRHSAWIDGLSGAPGGRCQP